MSTPMTASNTTCESYGTYGKRHTLQPIVTGTSILGVKYNGGVLLAADTLGSYGSMAMFPNIQRLFKLNEKVGIAASGDIADYQHIQNILTQQSIDDFCEDDNHMLSAKNVFSWLTRVCYNRRSKFDPLWNTFLVAGPDFLGCVTQLGVAFQSPTIATGFGAHLALPVLRSRYKEHIAREEAVLLLQDCMKLLYYRDARSWNKYQIMNITTQSGVVIADTQTVEADWSISSFISHH